ncbi:MAG TPA: hypothetical protein VGH03_00780 [Caulobacteraceae bacterium]|jgi:hypothetical protein
MKFVLTLATAGALAAAPTKPALTTTHMANLASPGSLAEIETKVIKPRT